ncbi:MAG: alpha/beta hydrolase [Alphaproteobacteria bacterium]|nr:alpha/beta hydrolase [Alphaproteobacteria bacterium]
MVIPLSKSYRCAQWLGILFVAMVVLALSPARLMAAPSNMSAYHVALQAPGQGTVRLYAEEHGHGRPVLLLHGLGASTFTWRNMIPKLARRHRVIALDLKGFGRSEKPFTQAYSPYDHANLVLAFIRKRKLRNLTIIGHSYGGAIALFATLRLNKTSPGRVRDLVLMNAPAYRQPKSTMVDFMNVPVLPYAALMLMPPELTTWLSLDKVQAEKLSYEEVRGYAQPFYDAAARHALITTARHIEPKHVDRLTARYPTIRQRTLILWCEDDRTVPISTGLKLAKTLPRGRLKVLKGCGHVPQDERPEAVNQLVSSFLRR